MLDCEGNGASSQQPTGELPKDSSLVMKLAPLCENEALRKDASFVDELSALLRHEPSIKINLQVLNIKK